MFEVGMVIKVVIVFDIDVLLMEDDNGVGVVVFVEEVV